MILKEEIGVHTGINDMLKKELKKSNTKNFIIKAAVITAAVVGTVIVVK